MEQTRINPSLMHGMPEDIICFDIERRSFYYRAMHWLKIYKIDNVKHNTYAGTCENPVKLHLIPYFGHMLIDEITTSDIQSYFNDKRKNFALETLKKDKACLYNIFEIAVADELRKKNPVSKHIVIKSDIPATQKHTWSQQQYNTVWKFARSHKFGLDIMLLMETAITRSELLGLTWYDYDSGNVFLEIKNGLVSAKNPHTGQVELLHDGLKNKYRTRKIPLSKELNGYLFLKARKTVTRKGIVHTAHIFHAPNGGAFVPENWYKRIYKRFMNDLQEHHPEIPNLTPHELRHTRATLLMNSGTDLFTVAELLGHKDLRMLRERYLHADIDIMRAALGL